MINALTSLLHRLDDPVVAETNIIPWGSPVPSFGDLSSSRVATLGLNPSNREFVDILGNELDGQARRFHTLKSLGLKRWSDAKKMHLELIEESCTKYFSRNPYNGWFKELDCLLAGESSYYYSNSPRSACHLDLIPYATSCKWTDLSSSQRMTLLKFAGDTLGLLLRDSPIELLVLNGKTVVSNLEELSRVSLEQKNMPHWTLPRKSGPGVVGVAYSGTIREICGVKLGREVAVLGFNHNIQSSFGVTNQVKTHIRHWVAESILEGVS